MENKIKPMNDVVAKIIFSNPDNRSLLEDLISTILNKDIYVLEVIPEATWIGNREEEKTNRTDMFLRTKEEWILFEIQGYEDPYYEQRITSSVAKAINLQLKKGECYATLKKVIVISIGTGFLKSLPAFYGKTVRVLEEYKDIQLFNQVEHYYLDIEKYATLPEIDIHNRKHQWAEFFKYERMEVLYKMAEQNDKVKKGLEILDKLRADETTWIQIERADEARELRRLELGSAKADGIAIGKEQGINIGKAQGINIGKEQGITIGKWEMLQKTIKNMLKKRMTDEMIKEITGINQKELEKQKELLQA